VGGDLDGTSWVLTSYDREGELTDVAEGDRVTAAFRAEQVSGNAGCNQYAAPFATSGMSVTTGPGITTLMACPEPLMELEAAYLADLARAATYTETPGQLTIYGSGGERILIFRVDPAVPITAGTFQATSLNNGMGGVESVPDGVDLTARFAMDGTVSGLAGCNTFRGPYAISEHTVTIGPLATTRKACADAVMSIEQIYLADLQAAVTMELRATHLQFRDRTGATQVVFIRRS
jgi:heat shock protein HslJ